MQATLFGTSDSKEIHFDRESFMNVITDRGSRYTVSGGQVTNQSEIKLRISKHLADKYFQKATHNTYAYRVRLIDGGIIEGKNDDGETGAGNCILRELQRENLVNCIVVVTRYFGGTQLHADRFRHVVDATKIRIEKIKNSSRF